MKKTTLENLNEHQDILFSTKERPIWQKVLAAILFTIVAACLYVFFTTFDIHADSNMAHFYGNTLEIAGFCFVMAVRCSLMKDYYFDLKDQQYKIVKRIGFIEIGKWKNFHDLDYVSVFKNAKGLLEINLWYNENNHFNLGAAENLAEALTAGEKIAEKLQIGLWDAATNPHEGSWVSIKTGTIAAR